MFVLVAWLLSKDFYFGIFPDLALGYIILLGILTSILFFASTLTHEFAHSLVAQREGIKIRRITLFLFGGVAELFDQPKSPEKELKISVAGPTISLLLSLVFLALYLFSDIFLHNMVLAVFFQALFSINLLLAIFNLLPGFPLDGGRILRSIVWYYNHDLKEATRAATITGKTISILIIVFGILKVFGPEFINGIWLILIGLFLFNAASQSYLELIILEKLAHVRAREIMIKDLVSVSPYLSINELLAEFFLKYNYTTLPVIHNGEIIGIVTLDDIRENYRTLNEESKVGEVMRRVDLEHYKDPESSAVDILKLMISNDLSFIPIQEDGRLVGIVTLDNIAKYLTEKKIL